MTHLPFITSKLKPLTFLGLLSFSYPLFAEEDLGWDAYHFKIFFENDLFSQTDDQYSSGEKLDLMYHVNDPQSPIYGLLLSNGSKSDIFISFAVSNQLYTPSDLQETEPILDQRAYAGWTYAEMAIHKSTKHTLNSIQLQVGAVGPASKGEEIQTIIHELTGSTPPLGWDNQLENTLGVNVSYAYKLRYITAPTHNFEVSFVPYFEADLGNVSTQASIGFFSRFGWNIAKDFGLSTLDVGGESGVPVYDEQMQSLKSDWSFSLNLTATGSAVAYDLFLDGTTLNGYKHDIEAKPFVGYVGAGISLRYKSFAFDFMQTMNSKKYDLDVDRSKKVVGTVVATWLF